MNKHLFFDDGRLFVNENTERRYGVPELCSVYSDGICSTDYPRNFVCRMPDGKYRLLYQGKGKGYKAMKLFCAESEDGINFVPARLCTEGADYPHEVMMLAKGLDTTALAEGLEVGFIYEDLHCDSGERFKMLLSDARPGNYYIKDTVLVSPDLVTWRIKENSLWGDSTEPIVSCFYNKHRDCHTVVCRPYFGVRRVGFKETRDWYSFTEWQPAVLADSLDEPLSEIYGMYAFEYDGMYIGLPHIYRGLSGAMNAKFSSGLVDTQLAYSYDGRYWQRSLRTPFIPCGKRSFEGADYDFKLMWTLGMQRADDGSLLFYCGGSEYEHGPAFSTPGTGRILTFRLRADGFIGLCTRDREKPSVVATREKIWHGGEVHINIKARKATCAVYSVEYSGNCLAFAKPIEGYTHEDCVPFSGDSTDWVPGFSSGKTLDALSGKTIAISVRFEDGELYSVSGDCTDAFNVEGARYRLNGTMPTVK